MENFLIHIFGHYNLQGIKAYSDASKCYHIYMNHQIGGVVSAQ